MMLKTFNMEALHRLRRQNAQKAKAFEDAKRVPTRLVLFLFQLGFRKFALTLDCAGPHDFVEREMFSRNVAKSSCTSQSLQRDNACKMTNNKYDNEIQRAINESSSSLDYSMGPFFWRNLYHTRFSIKHQRPVWILLFTHSGAERLELNKIAGNN